MASTISRPITRSHRIAAMVSIVFLSIALPVGIIVWSVISATSGKPLGRASNEDKDYFGALLDGHLYFPVSRNIGNSGTQAVEWRIKRLDLETGVESETGLVTGSERCWPCVVNDEVYGSGPDAVYKMDGSTLIKISAEHETSPIYSAQVFEFDGRLTNAVATADGEFQLCQLVDGHWVNGSKFRVPKAGSVWSEDQGRLKLRSPDSSMRALSAGNSLAVSVVQRDGQDHISVTDNDSFAAYRTGLEFVVDDQGVVSALNPENDLQDLSGWEPIQPRKPEHRRWADLESDREGVLFYTWPRQGAVVRRSTNGQWESLKGLCDLYEHSNRLVIASPSESRSYLVDKNRFSAVFYRIEGNVVHSPHLTLNGCGVEYLERWRRLFVGLLVAWLSHLAVLAGGIAWLRQGVPQPVYRFGNRCTILASIYRRVLATAIDCLLLLTMVFLLTYLQSAICGVRLNAICGVELKRFTEDELCHCLIEYEQGVSIGLRQGFELFLLNMEGAAKLTVALLFHPAQRSPKILIAAIVEAWCLFGLKIYGEGRFGVTPGKWLIGIRTLGSTLLPCGIARALTRNILLWIDIPFFVTPLPAAISILLSPQSQRLGDRIADTIVIRAGSIRHADTELPKEAQ